MKSFSCLLLLMFTMHLALANFNPNLSQVVRTNQYENHQQNTLLLKSDFGGSRLINNSELNALKGMKIYHIDFVYTHFRRSTDFDQLELNNARLLALVKLLPQLRDDVPSFTVYEQVGATNAEEAKEYFHGFVLHYGKDLSYPKQSTFNSQIQQPFAKLRIDNQKGGFAKYYSGTVIEMRKEIVYHKNGECVQGMYELRYREFRNPAEIALSGIPMNYTKGGNSDMFNSAGMYEIRAFKDGEELVLNEAAIVHFQCTEELEDMNFYSMSEEGEWSEIAPIQVISPNFPFNEGNISSYYVRTGGVKKVRFRTYVPEDEIDQGRYQGQTRVIVTEAKNKNQLWVVMTEEIKNKVRDEMSNRKSYWEDRFESMDTLGTIKSVLIYADDSTQFLEFLTGRKYEDLSRNTEKSRSVGEGDFTIYSTTNPVMTDSQLVKVYMPKGVPVATGIIAGLRSSTFGVYNCDQTRRIREPIVLNPVYYNKQTGEKLQNLYVTCVIDLNINASLSYHPNRIVCSKKGNTKLVVISEDNELFLFSEDDFSRLKPSKGGLKMEVTEITDHVQNPSDLQKILGVE